MWQNVIYTLTRNPMALKALLDVISPVLRGLIKQETTEDLAKLRLEVDALGRELPPVIVGLAAQQKETAQGLLELREALRRQEEREAALWGELERTRQELTAALAEVHRFQEESGLVGPLRRRWWPW